MSGTVAVDVDYTLDEQGYWVTASDGTVLPHGAADFFGDRPVLAVGEQVASLSPSPSGAGYWLFTDQGRVHGYGDAAHFGDLSTITTPDGAPITDVLNGPVVGSTATPTGQGYWMVASDGGIFAFGDAEFHGSMGGQPLNGPVVGLAPTPTNDGYWLVATDGGIFAFGDADFYGSVPGELAPGQALNAPVTSMIPQGEGYLMVASDGGIFNFGDSKFHGSLGGQPIAASIVTATVRSDRSGYLLADENGTAYAFGTSRELRSNFRGLSVPAPPQAPPAVNAPASPICAGQTSMERGDCDALVELYNSTGGPGWQPVEFPTLFEPWLSADPCRWDGVGCDGTGRVSFLQLREHGLDGQLPASLGRLTALESLELVGNPALSGPLPPELGNLTNLRTLLLQQNSFSGTLPSEFGHLTNLTSLDLSQNELTGNIPAALGNLVRLEHRLDLGQNSLDGALPATLGALAELRDLFLDGNQLSGPLPPELGYLTNLVGFSASCNSFSGALPDTLDQLVSLNGFNAGLNQFSGPIPDGLFTLPPDGIPGVVAFRSVLLDGNQLEGPIPSQALAMNHIDVAGNPALQGDGSTVAEFRARGWPIWTEPYTPNPNRCSRITIVLGPGATLSTETPTRYGP
ncbi:MAG: hypothetical protein AAFZ07_23365 [Actinomycetota bacterium]